MWPHQTSSACDISRGILKFRYEAPLPDEDGANWPSILLFVVILGVASGENVWGKHGNVSTTLPSRLAVPVCVVI